MRVPDAPLVLSPLIVQQTPAFASRGKRNNRRPDSSRGGGKGRCGHAPLSRAPRADHWPREPVGPGARASPHSGRTTAAAACRPWLSDEALCKLVSCSEGVLRSGTTLATPYRHLSADSTAFNITPRSHHRVCRGDKGARWAKCLQSGPHRLAVSPVRTRTPGARLPFG